MKPYKLRTISRLSDMTSEQVAAYKQNIQTFNDSNMLGIKYLEPYDKYDGYGLKFPIDYLMKMGFYIVSWPLEIMAQFVDQTTKRFIDNEDKLYLINCIYEYNFEKLDYSQLNATSIGNMAYACLHCKQKRARDIMEEQLNKILQFAYKTIDNQIQYN